MSGHFGTRALCRLAWALLSLCGAAQAQAPLALYSDGLNSGFQDWSWGTHVLQNAAPVHAGSAAISFTPAGWSGLLFVNPNTSYNLAAYESLTLWIHGGSGSNQVLRLSLLNGNSNLGDFDIAARTTGGIGANTWHAFNLPFDSSTGLTSGQFDRLQIMDFTGASQATVYIDDIVLPLRTTIPPAQAQSVAVNLAANRRPINPDIYGVNFGSDTQHAALHYPVRRSGGNSTTRYHWQFDTHSTGSDWFFQNIPDGDGVNLPADSTVNQFVATTRQYGGEPLVTASTIGWVPKDRAKRWGFSQAKYGPQLNDECRATNNAFWCTADAGDGTCNPAVNTTGYCIANPGGNPPGYIRNNDPTDTSMAAGPNFIAQYVGQFAGRPAGAVRFVSLDNEIMLWNSTHRDVHPAPVDYDELWATRTVPYASALKALDPDVKIFGPVTWGWCDLFTSAKDAAIGPSCINGADRQAHGGLPLAEWYLKQVCDYQAAHGVRLIDYLDVHYYPQGDQQHDLAGTGSVDESSQTAAWRLRSLRELYDPSYVQESWIAEAPQLIPRLRSWIAARCPGTKLALTEYKWGPDNGATGALAQAEALAIFGREGVDLATRWIAPTDGSYAEDAFRMFLNYDGAHSRVVGDSVRATSSNVDELGAYAIHRSGQHVFVLLFNKSTSPQDITVTVSTPLSGAWSLYRFDGSTHYAQVGTGSIAGTSLVLTAVPPRSSSLLVLPDGDTIFRHGFDAL